MEKKKIRGLVAAIVTPMDKNGNINLYAIAPYAEFLKKKGVVGVFVCGTTGEGILMDTEERKQVAEEWMKYSDDLKILVHVGSTSYKVSQELARHAEHIGAYAISAMGPCFLQPHRVEELVEFNRLIAGEAPNTPYYYYHIPATSGVNVNMYDFIQLADKRIPTFTGIKYTSYDTWQMQNCILYGQKKFDILHGHDETLINGLLLGAQGGIGTSYNVTAPKFNQLLEAFRAGRTSDAVTLQAECNKAVKIICDFVNSVVGIKAMLNICGIDCGPCRLPLQNLNKEEMKSLEERMKTIDWL